MTDHAKVLRVARSQYKLALAVRASCVGYGKSGLAYLGEFTWGKHGMRHGELSLTKEEEREASAALEHSATYVMIVQVDSVLEEVYPDRFNHPDAKVRNACIIARLIRNAFAHNPFNPRWQVHREWADKAFKVAGILSLNTKGLQGKGVKREHYGGPIALLRLLEFVAMQIDRAWH